MSPNKKKYLQLVELVNMESPDAILEEVKFNFVYNYPIEDFQVIRKVYNDFMKSARREGGTLFHDLGHAMGTLLAFSRMLDGYIIKKGTLPVEKVIIGHITAMLHDSSVLEEGPILNHTGKSTEILNDFLKTEGLDGYVDYASRIMECTDQNTDLDNVKFSDSAEELIAHMVSTANIVSQISSRDYLEKLLLLYDRINETETSHESILELLEKTRMHYREKIFPRLNKELNGLYKYCKYHFDKRYDLGYNIYLEAMERQMEYLEDIIQESPDNLREKIRRF